MDTWGFVQLPPAGGWLTQIATSRATCHRRVARVINRHQERDLVTYSCGQELP